MLPCHRWASRSPCTSTSPSAPPSAATATSTRTPGTTSLLPLDELGQMMDGLRDAFDIAPAAEVTLEANPGSLDEPYLQALLELGFNRLSIGVQSFHDDELGARDRLHAA